MGRLLYYILQVPNKTCVKANKAHDIPVTTELYIFQKSKNNSTGTTISNYLILIVVIFFMRNHSTIMNYQ